MTRQLPRIRRLKAILPFKKTAYREVAVVGTDQTSTRILLSRLLQAESAGTDLLHSDHPLAIDLRSGESSAPAMPEEVSFSALHLDPERRGKFRRWRFHWPRLITGGKGKEPEQWQELADTMLITWPRENLGWKRSAGLDSVFHLGGNLAQARDRGRLKRAAVVIPGVPAQFPVQHPCQVMIRLNKGEGFAAALRRQLAEAEGCCGHPLADPRWREFLQQEVLPSQTLARIVENTRIALGQDVPLFFLPENQISRQDMASLVGWIAHPKKQSSRLGRLAARLCTILAALVFGLGLFSWAVLNHGHRHLVPLAEASLASSPSHAVDLDRIESDLEDYLDHQASPSFKLACLMHGHAAFQDPLLQAREHLQGLKARHGEGTLESVEVNSFLTWAWKLEEKLEADLAVAARLSPAKRDTMPAHVGLAGLELVRGHLAVRQEWQKECSESLQNSIGFRKVDQTIADAAWLVFLSSFEVQLKDEKGTDRLVPNQAITKPLQATLGRCGFSSTVTAMNSLVQNSGDLKVFLNRPQDMKCPEQAWKLLPELSVDAVMDSIRSLDLDHLLKQVSVQQERLAQLVAASSLPGAYPVLDPDRMGDLEAMIAELEALTSTRAMTLTIKGAGTDVHFHYAKGQYEQQQTLLAPEFSWTAQLRPGQEIYLWYCSKYPTPIVVDANVCSPPHMGFPIPLCAARQNFQAQGQTFELEITDGWPSWPNPDTL
jgi:hypothetical protein